MTRERAKQITYYMVSIILVVLIEWSAHAMFQKIEQACLAHNGDMDNITRIYLCCLIAALVLFFARRKKAGLHFTIALILVILALAHVSYMISAIECCPGG